MYHVTYLSNKLDEFGVKQVTAWKRKTYDDFPDIESGIVHCTIKFLANVCSLTYTTRIDGDNLQIKHNGQLEVCNNCLSAEHLMRSCPLRCNCFACGLNRHVAADCPDKDHNAGTTSQDGRETSGSIISELASSHKIVIDEDIHTVQETRDDRRKCHHVK